MSNNQIASTMARHLSLLFTLTTASGSTLRGDIDTDASSTSQSHRNLKTITSIEDATLRSSTPYTNYGIDDDLSFIGNPTKIPQEHIESLVKFDIAEAQEPVYLQLYTNEHCDFATSPYSSQLGSLNVGLASNEMTMEGEVENWIWNEESVTWFNSPLLEEGIGKIVKNLDLLESQTWLEIGTFASSFR